MSKPYNPAIIRAMRAYYDADQAAVAQAADLSLRTYIEAERGRSCTSKTWDKIMAHFASLGASLVNVPCGAYIHYREGLAVDHGPGTDTINATKNAGPTQGNG